MKHSIYHSHAIYNRLIDLKICQLFPHHIIKHIMAILISVFCMGYRGKTVDFERCSPHHRTTLAYFLNHGKWNDSSLESLLKKLVISRIYEESKRSGQPIYCIVDDTISSKTKPSSRALHPIEDAYFHQSHLKGRQDYGHQAVAVMLSCNGIILNYAIVMYDKSVSKIDIVNRIAQELPQAPVLSYFLCDSWYPSEKLITTFIKKGFYTIAALKTNRILYPYGIKSKLSDYAQKLSENKQFFHLVTVKGHQYYVHRYEGKVNKLGNAVVLISYPKEAFGNPKALRAFLCTNVGLETQDILERYTSRWPIEIFFRQSKGKLAFDKYQIRSSKGIKRFWLLMSLAHYLCCTYNEQPCSFEDGYLEYRKCIQKEQIYYLYECGVKNIPFNEVYSMLA